MEKLTGDLLIGLKLVKLSILLMLFIQFVKSSLGEFKDQYIGFKGLNKNHGKSLEKDADMPTLNTAWPPEF